MQKRRLVVAAVAAWAFAGIAGAWSPEAFAGKPPSGGGGGTGGGKIWYGGGDGFASTMNSDGSGKTSTGTGLYPPMRTYGGHAWVLRRPPSTGSVEAVRDDSVRVQLTSSAVFAVDSFPPPNASYDWVPGRDAVSWVATRSSGGGAVEAGLYIADLAFAADGSIAGLVEQPATAAFPCAIDSSGRPAINRVSWAPDAFRFAWSSRGDAPSVHVADLAGNDRLLAASGSDPVWSPDGGRVVYEVAGFSGNELRSITPDGTGDFALVPRRTNQRVEAAGWSPTGSHVAYSLNDSTRQGGGRLYVYRIAATGGTATNLTPGVFLGWTQ